MLFGNRLMTSSTALRWKKKPLITAIMALFFLLLLITMMRGDSKKDTNPTNPSPFKNDDIRNAQGLAKKPEAERSGSELIEWNEPDGNTNPKSPGEGGRPVKITADESNKIRLAYNEYGFNQYVSDKISLHRRIPDIRPIVCHMRRYQARLPTVSVIVIFHNEGWSTLLRTVHSVLNRSPSQLLKEIVLVDDFSSKEHLKDRLEGYVGSLPKVKLVRTKQREGLIRARVYGADRSDGEVLLFLDSHCEANVGWLPPLLSEIENDYRTVVCPIIDPIDHRTFSYKAGHGWTRGTFSWRFDYKERSINADMYLKRKDEGQPVASPVMAGGLFAISRRFWEELGKYDPELYVWGGEQYELSFKLWMCGGRMFNVPCSRVGHVYRDRVPYKSNKVNAALINFKRVAEVWMDDFKEFLYHYRPDIGVQKHGDISARIALRKRLKCKSFEWYLLNVANDTVRTKYEPDRAVGQVVNVGSNLCMDFSNREKRDKNPMLVSKCPTDEMERIRGEISWTYIYELRFGTEMCAEGFHRNADLLLVSRCHETKGNQEFLYDKTSQLILHRASNSCVEAPAKGSDDKKIKLRPCDKKSNSQKWKMDLKDITGPVPDWAKIAYQFDKRRPKTTVSIYDRGF